ncbi:hypothetical protein F5884DRAFT_660376 [Xylogone sp. PMI_703]|nr:hypothetical protein F5884DRAFT_660376 [Xylogone sp. PMI_703]
MASVTSLDKDMRKLRMERYTPQAANEVRAFIEDALGEKLPPGELLDALKDGVALCKLANLALPTPLKFKQRAVMPFVQMENIALFLKACQSPPLNLQPHDVFLTVDLYEAKDPAQVVQCIGAFSRVAHNLQPSRFPNPIGAKSRSGVLSPQDTGVTGSSGNRGRGYSNASNSGFKPAPSITPTRTGESNNGIWGPTKSPTGVSSWSKKTDEGTTAPAWNIAQYGYMGGASQGNMGVAFGARRQITTAAPHVPSLAEKEKKRKEEEERSKREAQEEEQRKRREQQEEERARLEEEKRWEEETRKLREQERTEEKRKWAEEERQWKLEEERRRKEDEEAEARMREERNRLRSNSDLRLQGQFLSQYQAEHNISPKAGSNAKFSERERIRELERELAEARERERHYENERQARSSTQTREQVEAHDLSGRMVEESKKSRSRSRSRPRLPVRKNSDEVWREQEREYLQKQWASENASTDAPAMPPRPLPEPTKAPAMPPRPLPEPTVATSPRPLPDPVAYAASKAAPISPPSTNLNRTDRFLSSNPAPKSAQPHVTYSNEIGGFDSSAERDAEDRRRLASQTKTKAGGWASKSLLEREMELERQRQKEWEEAQIETQDKVATGNGVDGIGGGVGGKWDVNQWTGYTGGDSQNRGAQGIGAGRRQIVGPRPPPGR